MLISVCIPLCKTVVHFVSVFACVIALYLIFFCFFLYVMLVRLHFVRSKLNILLSGHMNFHIISGTLSHTYALNNNNNGERYSILAHNKAYPGNYCDNCCNIFHQ